MDASGLNRGIFSASDMERYACRLNEIALHESQGIFRIAPASPENPAQELSDLLTTVHARPAVYLAYMTEYDRFIEQRSTVLPYQAALPDVFNGIAARQMQHLHRAALLNRIINLHRTNGHYVDKPRNFSDNPAISHTHSVSILGLDISRDPGLAVALMAHDNDEDFPPVKKAYELIKRHLRESDDLEERAAQFSSGSLMIRGRDVGAMYWTLRSEATQMNADFVYGKEDTAEKREFRRRLDLLTKSPAQSIGVYYGEYLDGLFQDPGLVLGKLIDIFQNNSTAFNYRGSKKCGKTSYLLTKRLEGFAEAHMMIDRVKYYLRNSVAAHLIQEGSLTEDEYAFFENSLRMPRKGLNGEFDSILQRFQDAELPLVPVQHAEEIYMLNAGLATVVKKDLDDMIGFVKNVYLMPHFMRTGIGGRDAYNTEIRDIEKEVADYFRVGGFYSKTKAGKEWSAGEGSRTFSFDGFLDRICEAITFGDITNKYDLNSQDGVIGFLRDLYAFRGIFTVYVGNDALFQDDGALAERPGRGNGYISFNDYRSSIHTDPCAPRMELPQLQKV